MAYEQITNRPVEQGIHIIVQYANDVTGGLLMPMIVFMLYFAIGMGMYFSQERMTGKGDMAVCLAISSYIMVGFVILIGMIPGLINAVVVIEVIILASVGTLWLYLSKREQYQ